METSESQFRIGAAFAVGSNFKIPPYTELIYGGMVVHSSLVAFATEIFLKCALTISGIRFDRIHHLKGLFELLPSTMRDNIISDYNKSKENFLEMVKRIPDEARPPDHFSDFDNMLEMNSSNFQKWRYHYDYEWGESYSTLGTEAFCYAIHNHILALKPEWKKFTAYNGPVVF